MIIGDISIGDFAKVGAGAVVTHDVPPGCTAIGVPARLTNCVEAAIS
jgi:serine O-acetyltransferase